MKVFDHLEQLSRSFQCISGTISGMLHAVDATASAFQLLRPEEQFQDIFDNVTDTVQKFGIDPITLQFRSPSRLTGPAIAYNYI